MGEFKMRHTCLNCKHCEDDTCKKTGEEIEWNFLQEFKCCELSETALENERRMNPLF